MIRWLLVAALLLDPHPIPPGAEAHATADRLERWQETPLPPPAPSPFAPTGLSNCDEMSWYRQSVGLPPRFDALGWRESNCRNEDGVRTSCCYGWWQLNVGLHLRDHRLAPRYAMCGVDSPDDVNSDTPVDKLRQACAARAVFDVSGYGAWSL